MLYAQSEVELCKIGLGSRGLVLGYIFGLRACISSGSVMCLRSMIFTGGEVNDCVDIESEILAKVGVWVCGYLILLFRWGAENLWDSWSCTRPG